MELCDMRKEKKLLKRHQEKSMRETESMEMDSEGHV